ncbi:MAG: chromate transporter [Candidatus Caldatribacteriota bacterium]
MTVKKDTQFNQMKNKKETISLIELFWTFFRIGMLTFGGGIAMTMVMRHELVLKKNWMEDSDFFSIVALATAVPGVIAVNVAYLLGRRFRGWKGLILSVLGVVLPSFFIILLIVGILLPYFYNPLVVKFLRGCAIAVVGQLAFASVVFSRKSIRRWPHLAVCVIGIVIVGVLKLHPVFALVTVSIIGYFLFPNKKI